MGDAATIADIYRPYVAETATSFETEPPSTDEMQRRIADGAGYPWYVAEDHQEVIAYAYASKHRDRAAYQWSADVSIYSRRGGSRSGVGRTLYLRIIDDLRECGYVNAYAIIALPNDASVGFHESMGFEKVAHFKHAGQKFGWWYDVGWWQLTLREPAGALPPPRQLS